MIVGGLGGEKAVGRPVHSERDLTEAIRAGFRQEAVRYVASASGQTLKEMSAYLRVSYRSVMRRNNQVHLASTESDRLFRLVRIMVLAEHYIGDRGKAMGWLRYPNQALGGSTPLELLDTELGAREVEDVLGRIAYGGVS
ncbi:MAG TPA: antitoxin Xre/MbcA/ParS toxin-binding domain-containing protein [Edaphobacter sp.]